MNDTAQSILLALNPLADTTRAPAMAAYMKGQFAFLGIATPLRRQATAALLRAFSDHPLATAEQLWALPEREFHYVAIDLLRRHHKRLSASDLPGLEALVQRHAWWDSVDGLAIVIGRLVAQEPQLVARMDALIKAPDRWLRRIALLHQLERKAQTDRGRLFAYCLACADEPDFFIRKAIGWALRQYARTNPEAVRDFLAGNRQQLSALSVREAAKHL